MQTVTTPPHRCRDHADYIGDLPCPYECVICGKRLYPDEVHETTETPMTDTRFTDPNVDPAAGAPGALALLRGSRWISEPAPDQRWDGTKHLNVEGWAYAEVGCGDTPTVSFRVPLDDHGWACMSTDDVTVFASMLIRLAGVARTWTALDAEGCDLP